MPHEVLTVKTTERHENYDLDNDGMPIGDTYYKVTRDVNLVASDIANVYNQAQRLGGSVVNTLVLGDQLAFVLNIPDPTTECPVFTGSH